MKRRTAGWLGAALLLTPGALQAGDWEIELGLGGARGPKYTRGAPFEFQDLTFAGPYSQCPGDAPAGACQLAGLTDVVYALESRFTLTGLAGLDVRRRLSDSVSLGVGVLAGLAPRNRSLLRLTNGELDPRLPPEPDDLIDAAIDARNQSGRLNGVGALTYLGAGFRFEKGFESRTSVGYRSSSVRVFVDGGGGLLALVPDKKDADLGTPPAFHVAGGLRIRRGSGKAITVSLYHLHALANTDHLLDAGFSWTGVRVGWVSER
jgi:hypothetical protein